MTFTAVEFVRQRAAMIDLFARSDPDLTDEGARYIAGLTDSSLAEYTAVGRALFEAQRDTLIASDMYLFTRELATCARQALDALDTGEYLDLDPLPPGAVFAFTEPVEWPGTSTRFCSVMLPMPELTFVSTARRDEPLRVRLMTYALRSTLRDHAHARIAAGDDVDFYERSLRELARRSRPWHLAGLELDKDEPEKPSWALLLRAAVTFARSPGIAQMTRAPIPRSIVRAASRAAPLPDSGIRVVDLRPRPATSPREPSTETTRALQHRVVVRGHWRHQACGPGHAERRLVWIDQHLRGPETAPIKGTERVYFGREPK
jgi:hypothetical protein